MRPILACQNLTIAYGPDTAVTNVSFSLIPGECLALVGRSGSGKSTIARAVIGLHRRTTRVSGHLSLAGHDLLNCTDTDLANIRGRLVGYIAQDPYATCDPLRTVGHHLSEAWRCHGVTPKQSLIDARLNAVGIENAPQLSRCAPHCWSGGMLQRACIAAASAHSPPVIIADEPTSALDPDRADGILTEIRASGAAVLLISHDLELVRKHADRVIILHEGRVIDEFPVADFDTSDRHRTTRGLIRLSSHRTVRTSQNPGKPLLRAHNLIRSYASNNRTIGPVSFELRAAACVGLSGRSGSGKTTVLRMIAGLEHPDQGHIQYGPALARAGSVMPVFQNPVDSLNPLWPIWRSISEPATVKQRMCQSERIALTRRLLEKVGLDEADVYARPEEFSIGQCQRIAIARAIAATPHLLVADEPTSALDTIARAQVVDLLARLVDEGMSLVIASHDRWVHRRLNAKIVNIFAT